MKNIIFLRKKRFCFGKNSVFYIQIGKINRILTYSYMLQETVYTHHALYCMHNIVGITLFTLVSYTNQLKNILLFIFIIFRYYEP